MSKKEKKLDTDQVVRDLGGASFFPGPQEDKTTSTQVGKPTKPQVEKYTTHLQPATIKAVKRYAFEHDLKDYEVVQAALEDYLERQKDEASSRQ